LIVSFDVLDDVFGLADGLTFGALSFADADADGNGEIIASGETLAEVAGVSDTALNNASLFTTFVDGGGGTGGDTFTGTPADDTLTGTVGDDDIRGLAGADSIDGGDGNDTLNGDVGNDTINGGDGVDFLLGAASADDLNGGAGDDSVRGGGGQDTVRGGPGNDTVAGNAGFDTFVLAIGEGTDLFLSYNPVEDTLALAGGLTFGDLTFTDVDGNGSGEIVANGEALAEVIGMDTTELNDASLYAPLAAPVDQTITGTGGNDTLTGGLGSDVISGFAGDDSLIGGGGDDSLNGGLGNDTISSEGGNDTLIGAAGDDSLLGGNEDDLLRGGDGVDTLRGGAGSDTLAGNDGVDTYVLAVGEGRDVLTTFDPLEDVFGLADGLTFGALSFADADADGDGEIVASGETLAEVAGVSDTDLNDASLYLLV
jgi:Ca2+-binding RTX toxin-like protein